MNKNKKWLLVAGIATMITANGLVMAATTSEKQDTQTFKPHHAFAEKGDFSKRCGMRGFHGDNTALIEFLKVDAQTLKNDREAGKTLVAIAEEHGVSEQALKDFMIGQMTQRVDEAIKAGRMPADKAEKMKTNMDERVSNMINGKGRMGHGPMRGHKMMDNTALIEFLKVDAQTLKNDREAGKTLVAIAEEHGVSEQALKDFMIGQMTQHCDEAVKAGRMPADKAEKMKSDMDEHVSNMINGKGPMGHGPMREHKMMDNTALIEFLKVDAQTLKNDREAGKTLVAIAEEHGVTEQALKDFMIGQMTQHCDEAVAAGRIPADKAEKMKANMDERVSNMINGKRPIHAHKERNNS